MVYLILPYPLPEIPRKPRDYMTRLSNWPTTNMLFLLLQFIMNLLMFISNMLHTHICT